MRLAKYQKYAVDFLKNELFQSLSNNMMIVLMSLGCSIVPYYNLINKFIIWNMHYIKNSTFVILVKFSELVTWDCVVYA